MKGTYNTTGRRVPGLLRTPYNPCSLNPDDLAELGLADGDLVRVTSDHGSVAAVVQADRTLRRGAVSLSHVFVDLPGNDDDPRIYGSNPGRLLSAVVDVKPLSGQPWMTAVPVSIEPLEPAIAGRRAG
jgi:anaerobic selenocysteine-containing dehydrogenase